MKPITRKIACGAVAASLMMSMLTGAQVFGATLDMGDSSASAVKLKVEPISVSGYTFAGMRDVFSALGYTVEWYGATRTASAQNAKANLNAVFTVNSIVANVNGSTVTLPAAPKIINNSLMIPISIIGDLYNKTAIWNPASDSIVLEPLPEDVTATIIPGYITDKTRIIEYPDALNMVIQTSGVVSTYSDQLTSLETSRPTILDSINVASSPAASVSAMYKLKQLDVNVADNPRNKQIATDQQELKLRSQLTTIAATAMSIQASEEAIRLSQISLTNLKIQEKLGMASAASVVTAQQKLDQSNQSLASSQISLTSQRQALNQMLGLALDSDVAVDFTPDISAMPTNTADSYASSAVAGDITMKMAQEQMDLAQFQYDHYISTDQASLTIARNTYIQAQKTLSDAKTAMDKAVRSAYNAIQQTNATMQTNQISLQTAKDTYRQALVNYSVGANTYFDVENAKYGVLTAEIAIRNTTYALSNQLYAFAKPYLL